MRDRLRRLRCVLWGCCVDHWPLCYRCQASLYDDPVFIERGWLPWWLRRYELWQWLVGSWYVLCRVVWPRCQGCGRHLWPWLRSKARREGFDANFCSDACFTAWLPF